MSTTDPIYAPRRGVSGIFSKTIAMRTSVAKEILVQRSAGRWLASAGGQTWPCAIGRGGVTGDKREGDGATPEGRFRLRKLYFRPDKGLVPRCGLPLEPLHRGLGWCDAPLDAAYNRVVSLPWRSSAERLWRADSLYDLIIPLGHNDGPYLAGRGSAIFLHCARPGLTGTEGCIALRRDDLLAVLALVDRDWYLRVERGS